MNSKLLRTYLHYLVALVPFKHRRLDAEFLSFLYKLHDNEHKSYEEMRQYQFLKLKELVISAYKYTEFYKNKFDQAGFHPDQLKSLDDLNKIPMLTKDEVRNFGKEMIVKSYKGKIYSDHTSGTTGKSLQIFRDKTTNSREWAAICYQWERVGYTPFDGRVEFRGVITSNDDYIYLPNQRTLRINLIKLSSQNIRAVIGKIKKTGYKYFHGYPSGIVKLTKILVENNLNIEPEAILFASEILYDWQIEVVAKAFPRCKMTAHYGQTEKIALGAWTDDRNYHFIPTYGIVEKIEHTEELVATGFINEVMPLIRYKLTDTASGFSLFPKKARPMLYPVIDSIVGRLEDLTYTNAGEIVPPAVVTFPFKNIKYISACKLIQFSLTDFTLIIEGTTKQTKEEAVLLEKNLKIIYGLKSNFTAEFVDQIPIDKSGKFRWIENRMQAIK